MFKRDVISNTLNVLEYNLLSNILDTSQYSSARGMIIKTSIKMLYASKFIIVRRFANIIHFGLKDMVVNDV